MATAAQPAPPGTGRLAAIVLRTQSDGRLLALFREGSEAAFEIVNETPLVAGALVLAGALLTFSSPWSEARVSMTVQTGCHSPLGGTA